MNSIRAGSALGQGRSGQIGQTEGFVRLPNDQQTAVRTELGAAELQPYMTVKIKPQTAPRACPDGLAMKHRPHAAQLTEV